MFLELKRVKFEGMKMVYTYRRRNGPELQIMLLMYTVHVRPVLFKVRCVFTFYEMKGKMMRDAESPSRSLRLCTKRDQRVPAGGILLHADELVVGREDAAQALRLRLILSARSFFFACTKRQPKPLTYFF